MASVALATGSREANRPRLSAIIRGQEDSEWPVNDKFGQGTMNKWILTSITAIFPLAAGCGRNEVRPSPVSRPTAERADVDVLCARIRHLGESIPHFRKRFAEYDECARDDVAFASALSNARHAVWSEYPPGQRVSDLREAAALLEKYHRSLDDEVYAINSAVTNFLARRVRSHNERFLETFTDIRMPVSELRSIVAAVEIASSHGEGITGMVVADANTVNVSVGRVPGTPQFTDHAHVLTAVKTNGVWNVTTTKPEEPEPEN